MARCHALVSNVHNWIGSVSSKYVTFTSSRCFASSSSSGGGSSRHRKERGQGSYKFVDRAKIRARGGSGGKGCISHHHVGSYKRVADGGKGGNGGAVVLVADKNLQSLNMSKHHFAGEDGKHGTSQNMHGRRGKNTVLRVPRGVVVRRVLDWDETWDADRKTVVKENRPVVNFDESWTDEDVFLSAKTLDDSRNKFGDISDGDLNKNDSLEVYEETIDNEDVDNRRIEEGPSREKIFVGDLDKAGAYIVVARGGKGGLGNYTVSTRNYDPVYASKAGQRAIPQLGEVAHLELELKLIADLGLVGFPNAGKSSLLSAMSRASPEIAPYPFGMSIFDVEPIFIMTTLNPLIGSIEYKDDFRVCAADVPGIIEGASEGRGRGLDFLRHIERTKALMYIVDIAGVDGRCPVNDLKILVDEIANYGDGHLLERPALVVANKIDLFEDAEEYSEILLQLHQVVEDTELNVDINDVVEISAACGNGLQQLSRIIRQTVKRGHRDYHSI